VYAIIASKINISTNKYNKALIKLDKLEKKQKRLGKEADDYFKLFESFFTFKK
jgi:hypothetical protein